MYSAVAVGGAAQEDASGYKIGGRGRGVKASTYPVRSINEMAVLSGACSGDNQLEV